MANHCVYEKCPDCGAEECVRCCGYSNACTCSSETIEARHKLEAQKLAEAEKRLMANMPDGWF